MYKPTTQNTAIEPINCATCETLQLCQLRCGDRATVIKVGGSLPMRRRLAEMGVLRGVDLVIKSAAPLGDPIAYEVRGYHLALRRTDAEQIEVRLVNPMRHARPDTSAEVSCG